MDRGLRSYQVSAVSIFFDTGWLVQTLLEPEDSEEGDPCGLEMDKLLEPTAYTFSFPENLPRCFSSTPFQTLYWSQNMAVHNSWIYLMSLLLIQTAGDNKRCLKENPIKYSRDYKGQERPE